MGDGNTSQDNLLNIHRRDPLRDTQQWRIANRSEWGSEQARQSLGIWWQNTEDLFKNPNLHTLRDTDTRGVQYQFKGDVAALEYPFGMAYTDSSGTRTLYANNPQNGTRDDGKFDDAGDHAVISKINWVMD